MSAPTRIAGKVDLALLESLFLMLGVVIPALAHIADISDVLGQARDLRDAITALWRATDVSDNDELPF